MTKLNNKNGELSQYAFLCGYIQNKPLRTIGGQITLFLDGAVWHVQGRDDSRGRFLWETFDNLTEARIFYRKQKGA